MGRAIPFHDCQNLNKRGLQHLVHMLDMILQLSCDQLCISRAPLMLELQLLHFDIGFPQDPLAISAQGEKHMIQ